ncbi:50S ribosomal protein L9 [Patescibacteria group bacterium]|nr:50S ribosomal protein L9 [Patescibacteria group bacterium]
MQIIFTKDLKGVAYKGDVKNVAEGYYRNFLASKNVAIKATPAQIKQAEEIQKHALVKKERLEREAGMIKDKLESKTYEIKVKVSDKDKLYGSVGEKEVIEIVEQVCKVELDKSNVKIKKSIKSVGEHEVKIALSADVTATIKINVVGEK